MAIKSNISELKTFIVIPEKDFARKFYTEVRERIRVSPSNYAQHYAVTRATNN